MGQSLGLARGRPTTQTVLVGAVWTAAAAAARAVEASEAAGAAPGTAFRRPTATTHTKQQRRVSHQPVSGATKQKKQKCQTTRTLMSVRKLEYFLRTVRLKPQRSSLKPQQAAMSIGEMLALCRLGRGQNASVVGPQLCKRFAEFLPCCVVELVFEWCFPPSLAWSVATQPCWRSGLSPIVEEEIL